jgi:hypothetical protein
VVVLPPRAVAMWLWAATSRALAARVCASPVRVHSSRAPLPKSAVRRHLSGPAGAPAAGAGASASEVSTRLGSAGSPGTPKLSPASAPAGTNSCETPSPSPPDQPIVTSAGEPF